MSEMGGWGFRRDCQACWKTLGKDRDGGHRTTYLY